MKTLSKLPYRYPHPLPAGCTIIGDASLCDYIHPLPEGFTIGGSACLCGYAHVLPPGCTIGMNACFCNYDHPLPADLTIKGSAFFSGYRHPLPKGIKIHDVSGVLLAQRAGYALWAGDDGLFYYGYRHKLTLDQAISHWDRDERYVLCTDGIIRTLRKGRIEDFMDTNANQSTRD